MARKCEAPPAIRTELTDIYILEAETSLTILIPESQIQEYDIGIGSCVHLSNATGDEYIVKYVSDISEVADDDGAVEVRVVRRIPNPVPKIN
jgi:hypothetical protein